MRDGKELQLLRIELRKASRDFELVYPNSRPKKELIKSYQFPDISALDKKNQQTRPALVFNKQNNLMGLWIDKETKKLYSLSNNTENENNTHQLDIIDMARKIQERIEYPIAA